MSDLPWRGVLRPLYAAHQLRHQLGKLCLRLGRQIRPKTGANVGSWLVTQTEIDGGRDATRRGRTWMVIANHLLGEEGKLRVQVPLQWDQRAHADARQIGCILKRGGRRSAKVSGCNPDRTPASVRQFDDHKGGAPPRTLRQDCKLLTRERMPTPWRSLIFSRSSRIVICGHPVIAVGA